MKLNAITGEEFQDQTILLVAKKPNETWFDGPCRECICLTREDSLRAECSIKQCPLIFEHPDYNNYEIEARSQMGECCPEIVRTSCKYEDLIYQVGESWTATNDSCTKLSCIEKDGIIVKETYMETCDKTCKMVRMLSPKS